MKIKDLSYEEFEKLLVTETVVIPQTVADRIHATRVGAGKHTAYHSCACAHLALYYLGLTEDHGLYWPDNKGGNAWDKPTGEGS
jgi:hypothetical protein